MNTPIKLLPSIGRLLIGVPFIMSGLGKIASYDATVSYISSVGLPLPSIGWLLAATVETFGGMLLIAGFKTKPLAFVLALFTLVTAIFFHQNFSDQNQMIHFLKNLMLVGGLLQIAYFGSGPFGVDNQMARESAA